MPATATANPIRTLVDNFVSQLAATIEDNVRAELSSAISLIGGITRRPTPAAGGRVRPAAQAHRPAATPKLTRARALQGKYLGALRTATGNRRARAKALAKKDGVAAALKFLGAGK